MNQHRSKAMHIMNTRQIKLKEGTVDDIEVTRREAARPDGTLVYRGTKDDLEIIQPDAEFLKQTQYYQDAKAEIDTFGPNQQLIQEFGQNVSGRAANMLQQAGLAELGPFLKNFRMWKLQRYQSCWNAAQRYWTSERMMRVTNDPQAAQAQQMQEQQGMLPQQPNPQWEQLEQKYSFMTINSVDLDQYGMPQLVNVLGNIDVEIKVDEGPDTETIMGDVFDLLMALAQNNVPVPPAAIIEASYLPLSEKKKLQQMVSQVDPAVAAQKQLGIQQLQANVGKTQAEAAKLNAGVPKEQTAAQLNVAKAQAAVMPDAPPAAMSPLDTAEKIANINATNATAMHKRATAANIYHGALMSPLQMMADHAQKNADRSVAIIQRNVDTAHQNADRLMSNQHQNADRAAAAQQQAADRAMQSQVARNVTPE
jgi:hypothetical protein